MQTTLKLYYNYTKQTKFLIAFLRIFKFFLFSTLLNFTLFITIMEIRKIHSLDVVIDVFQNFPQLQRCLYEITREENGT